MSNKNTSYKDSLDHTIKRKERHKDYIEGEENLYNPDVTEREQPEIATRVSMKQKITEEKAKHKPILKKHEGDRKTWRIFTDGSYKDGNTSKARDGAGTYCSEDESKTKAIKVPGRAQTNQRAELIAILTAIESVKKGD